MYADKQHTGKGNEKLIFKKIQFFRRTENGKVTVSIEIMRERKCYIKNQVAFNAERDFVVTV